MKKYYFFFLLFFVALGRSSLSSYNLHIVKFTFATYGSVRFGKCIQPCNNHDIEQFGGLRRRQEDVGQFGTSSRHAEWLWPKCHSDIDNEAQSEVVSNEYEELIENWSVSHSFYASGKRLAAFCPCTRDLWNFELDRNNLGYLAEEISKQRSIQLVTWLFLKVYTHMCEQRD